MVLNIHQNHHRLYIEDHDYLANPLFELDELDF
jgi:hypothetical protein